MKLRYHFVLALGTVAATLDLSTVVAIADALRSSWS